MLRTSIRRSLPLVVAAMSLGGARLAAAQPEPIALTWHAPPGCPTAAGVTADVGQNLAASGIPFSPFVAVVGVRGPAGGRWQASLLFESGSTRAERRFEAESCEAIASAAAFVIALWAEGGADPTPGRTPATAPGPFVAPPPQEVHRTPVVITAASPPRAPAAPGVDGAPERFVLMFNWLVDRNTMPEAPALGMEVAGGPTWSGAHWRLRALGGLSYFMSQRTPFMYGLPQGDMQLFNASSRGCLTVVAGRFEIGPCAGAELAVMHVSSVDGATFMDPTQHWLSLLGSVAMSWRVYSAVAIFGRFEVVKPTAVRTFNMADDMFRDSASVWLVYRLPDIAARGAVGLELRFW